MSTRIGISGDPNTLAEKVSPLIQMEIASIGAIESAGPREAHPGYTILLQEVYRYRTTPSRDGKPSGELVATGLRPKFLDKLGEMGIEVPAKVFHSHAVASATGERRSTRQVRVPNARSLASPERAK